MLCTVLSSGTRHWGPCWNFCSKMFHLCFMSLRPRRSRDGSWCDCVIQWLLLRCWTNIVVFVVQLESNVEFKEFLEVHKPRVNKSAWSNDIVLSSAELPKDEKLEIVTSKETSKHASLPETAESTKHDKTKKLSDLEVSIVYMWMIWIIWIICSYWLLYFILMALFCAECLKTVRNKNFKRQTIP